MRIINSVLDEVYVCFFDLDEDGGTSKTASHGPDRAATGEWVEDDAWDGVAGVVAGGAEADGYTLKLMSWDVTASCEARFFRFVLLHLLPTLGRFRISRFRNMCQCLRERGKMREFVRLCGDKPNGSQIPT